jgi:hypothetical protein
MGYTGLHLRIYNSSKLWFSFSHAIPYVILLSDIHRHVTSLSLAVMRINYTITFEMSTLLETGKNIDSIASPWNLPFVSDIGYPEATQEIYRPSRTWNFIILLRKSARGPYPEPDKPNLPPHTTAP